MPDETINLRLERNFLADCPFCGGKQQEPCNTHTASYWIECECGAEIHGKAFGRRAKTLTMAHHRKAKQSAIAAWNRRDTPDD